MSNTIKILIVDDESIGRDLLEAILIPEGYQVLFGANGEEALEIASNKKPDIILCDVMMPKLDGFGVAKKLRENAETAHIPLLLITALDDRESRIRGIDAGADDYISKPFNRLEILAKVKNHGNLIQYRLGINNGGDKHESDEYKKLSHSLTQAFDNSLLISSDGVKSEIHRFGKSDGSKDMCSRIISPDHIFYLCISNQKSEVKSVIINTLFIRCFENNVLRGENSPCKLISMVFDDLRLLSSEIDMNSIDEPDFTIAVLSISESDGSCKASGLNQRIIADVVPSASASTDEKDFQAFELKPDEDVYLSNLNQLFILSASTYATMLPEDILTRLSENYLITKAIDVRAVFSPVLSQTQDLLILKLSF